MRKRETPIHAIRRRCKECKDGRVSLVRKCEDVDCPLHLFRLGTNPWRKGIGGPKRIQIDQGHQGQGLQVENGNSSSVISKGDQPTEGVVPVVLPPSGPVGGTYFAARSGLRRPGTV